MIFLWLVHLLLISNRANAIELVIENEGTIYLDESKNVKLTSTESIKDAANTAVYAMMTYYKGNETGQIPGAFSTKWWEGSALFLALLQYWHFTGDTTYNDELRVGLQWQSGTNGDYMPSNYSSYLVRHDTLEK